MDSTGLPTTMTTMTTAGSSSDSTGPSVDDTGTETGPDETTGDSGSSGDSDSDSTGETGTEDTGPGDTGTTDTGTTDTGTTDAGESTSTGEPPDPPDPLPNGSQCSSDEECESNQCFVAGVLGGICGECNEDADCVGGGCTPANPITSAPPVCNDGELADGCESTAACMPGLECASILSVPGILDANTCSECLDDTDCPGQTCQPSYDVPGLTGVLVCVDLGSLADGDGCDLATGAAACSSGTCAAADFMMLFELGVCSECQVDADCPGGTCQGPEIDLVEGLIAGTCI